MSVRRLRPIGRWWILVAALSVTLAAAGLWSLTPLQTRVLSRVKTTTLAYVDDLGDIWIVGANGRGKRRVVARAHCGVGWRVLKWSPLGDRIVCYGQLPEKSPDGAVVTVIDLAGRTLSETRAGGVAWSPSGQYLSLTTFKGVLGFSANAHLIADKNGGIVTRLTGRGGFGGAWSSAGSAFAYPVDSNYVGIYDLTAGRSRTLKTGMDVGWILGWVLGDSALLVASDIFEGPDEINYKAFLVSVTTGRSTRLPSMDGAEAFRVSPDGTKVSLPLNDAPRESWRVGAIVGVLDLATLQVSRVAGSVFLRSSGDQGPEDLAFDGKAVIWVLESTIFRARADGGGLTTLMTLDTGTSPASGWRYTSRMRFSRDLSVAAYIVSERNQPESLWIAPLGGGQKHKVDTGGRSIEGLAWWPTHR